MRASARKVLVVFAVSPEKAQRGPLVAGVDEADAIAHEFVGGPRGESEAAVRVFQSIS